MPCPWHSFDRPNNIWWGVQIIKLLIIWFFPLPCYLIPSRLNCAPSTSVLKHPQPTFLPQFEWPSSKRQYKATGKIIVLCIVIFVFSIAVWMRKVSGPTAICFKCLLEWWQYFDFSLCKYALILGFHSDVAEDFIHLGCYTALLGEWAPMLAPSNSVAPHKTWIPSPNVSSD